MSITVKQLVNCGLFQSEAEHFAAQLEELRAVFGEHARWERIVTELLTPAIALAVHELLYEQNYQK